MSDKTLKDKLKGNIENIAGNYFLDLSELPIADKGVQKVEQWNLTSMMLGYAMKKNVLLIGEPGWGKTTASAMVGCASNGLPMDLFRSLLISGHPDQSEEKMIARPDYGKLMSDQEKIVWQKALFFPLIQLDEFNRLSQGKQSELLDGIATGRFAYLNDVYFDGEKSFFATINHHDGGNHEITPPALDRFHLSVEFGYQGSLYDETMNDFNKNAREKLIDSSTTTRILDLINNKSKSVKEKLEEIEEVKKDNENFKKAGFEFISKEEYTKIHEEIEAIEFDQDAQLFIRNLNCELNTTPTYGRKRSCDPIDGANHAKERASTNIINGFSPRGFNESVRDYSKALAWYTGNKKVSKAHIEAISPYTMAHRLKFNEDFRAKHEDAKRKGTIEEHLSRALVKVVDKRFEDIKNKLYIVDNYIGICNKGENPKKKMKRVDYDALKDLVKDVKQTDNPFLKECAEHLIRHSTYSNHLK